ncbi:unnamed protein product [Haemonchus placei]|uniref:C2H2-type domain-containing protein n=1 Tax=Haemonchus placei TaxID=6290 RepID=A0A0N4WJX8_HAEPC|nr:unnamed protein product [Haemonchus placei]
MAGLEDVDAGGAQSKTAYAPFSVSVHHRTVFNSPGTLPTSIRFQTKMSSENIDNMNDTGARGSLNGVEELVTFLGCASSNDRSAFSKRANIIFECRTCFTLFRKADGFMRHVTRCDSSRGTDAESEPERRTLYVSPAPVVPSAGRVSRVVPLKKPIATGAAYLHSTPPAPVLQQEAVIKQPPVKPRGRPPKAEKMNVAKLPVKKEDDVFVSPSDCSTADPKLEKMSYAFVPRDPVLQPTPTPPTVVMATGNGTLISPSRAPKRAYNRKVTPVLTPQKIQKTDNNDGGEEAISVSSKSAKSDDPDLSAEIRPSRMRKTPKWLEDSAFVV